jgi:DNA polymerase III subunit epsilon
MREVVLDCETTGLWPGGGDRIVSIACVELVDRKPTGRTFHSFINPERQVPPAATKVHGITNFALRDKPKFAAIANQLGAFLAGATLIAHNAPFDASFINAEFGRLDHAGFPLKLWVDTNAVAQKQFGRGKGKTTLDALVERFKITRSRGDKHSALVDAELLVEVYLALTVADNQHTLGLTAASTPSVAIPTLIERNRPQRPSLLVHGDAEKWTTFVETIPDAIWDSYTNPKKEAA